MSLRSLLYVIGTIKTAAKKLDHSRYAEMESRLTDILGDMHRGMYEDEQTRIKMSKMPKDDKSGRS